MAYITRETSCVLFERNILMTCGTNEEVVQMAAINPIKVVPSTVIICAHREKIRVIH